MVAANLFTPEWKAEALSLMTTRFALPSDAKVGLVDATQAICRKSKGNGSRDFTARITVEQMDRDREVLLPQGMDPTDFKKTGAIFWNHDYDRPIGHGDNLTKGDDHWSSDGHIMKRPDDWAGGEFFPDLAWEFVSQVPNAGISVGFMEIEGRAPSKKDKELYGSMVSWTVTKWKLLEWSVAPLQACVDAIVLGVKGKRIKAETAEVWVPGIKLQAQTRRMTVILALESPRQKRPKRQASTGTLVEILGQSVQDDIRKRRGSVFS